MDRIEQAEKAFLVVRDWLYENKHMTAYRLSYKKPLKFYREHAKEDAIKILMDDAKKIEGND